MSLHVYPVSDEVDTDISAEPFCVGVAAKPPSPLSIYCWQFALYCPQKESLYQDLKYKA